MLSIANIGFAWLHSTSTISYYNTSFFNNYLNGHCIYKNIKILEKFCLKNAIFSLIFSLKIKEIGFWWAQEKTPSPPKFHQNQTPLPPILSHFFFILLILSPTKWTLSDIMFQVPLVISWSKWPKSYQGLKSLNKNLL